MGLPLRVEGLGVTGEGGRPILTIGALELAAGESLGVRGPSGAGKSTLLYALAGLLPRARGTVLWGETDLLGLGPAARARFRRETMGFVFQEALLFEEMNAAGNAALQMAFAAPRRRRAIAERARRELAALGVPEGRRRAGTYSGGERQRISLARALAADPAVLLADEPTASLDPALKTALAGDLTARTRRDGVSLIAVSHDETLLAAMDRVVTIANGELVAA